MRRQWNIVLSVGVALLMCGAAASVGAAWPSAGRRERAWLGGVAVVLGGVGASLLASGVAYRLLRKRVAGIDAEDLVRDLQGSARLYRAAQYVDLTLRFSNDGKRIIVEAAHAYELTFEGVRAAQIEVRMSSSIARFGDEGEFVRVKDPDSGGFLSGAKLESLVHEVGGKKTFAKTYRFVPGVARGFEFQTRGLFERHSVLVWTVDHICADFDVRVRFPHELSNSIKFRVNHHLAAEMPPYQIEPLPDETRQELRFHFNAPVLPFQGFELRW
jgi:hypothetical protein